MFNTSLISIGAKNLDKICRYAESPIGQLCLFSYSKREMEPSRYGDSLRIGMITLEPFDQTDVNRLCSWFATAQELSQWGGPSFQFPLTPKRIGEHLLDIAKSNGTHFAYRVRDAAIQSVVGHGELTRVDAMHRSARISRVLVGPISRRGKGYGTQIVRSLMAIAFDQLSLHRLELEVYDFNAPAIRCYEKLGFVREGLRRDAVRCGSQYWNSILMSCLEHERKQL